MDFHLGAIALLALLLVLHAHTAEVRQLDALISETPTASDILSHSGSSSSNERAFKGAGKTLIYVTPWNNRGYDAAKQYGAKLDYVSPVWFTLRKSVGQYSLDGEHDVDAGWMEDVRKGAGSDNHTVKIVPRFLVELTSPNDVMQLSQQTLEARTAADIILDASKRLNFDGVVLECGVPTMMELFLETLGTLLHEAHKELILVIAPWHKSMHEMLLFGQQHVQQYAALVDAFSLMTYDYSQHRQEAGPNAPIEWVEENVKRYAYFGARVPVNRNCSPQSTLSLVPDGDDELRSRILVGVNFYGMDFAPGPTATPILGSAYLDLLRKYKPELQWDAEAAEHSFTYVDNDASHTVWYPSLMSLDERLALIESLRCGVAVWDSGQGLEYFWGLL
ncbi:Chitinase domain-containing protein 1 [Sorochytrium milnesiophthora]